MGMNTREVWLLAVVVAYLGLLPLCRASLCEPGLEYWSDESESCVSCSICDSSAKHIVIRPCQAHTDTICGPISDLDIDWSWLKHRRNNKHQHPSDRLRNEKKHHNKKVHKHNHHFDSADDMQKKPFHQKEDNIETTVLKHSGGHKHHKELIDDDVQNLMFEGKQKKPHMISENFLFDDFDSTDHKKLKKVLPPPPLKSTVDLEKEWKEWLIQSKNRLQHRKDDLLKNLHKESPYNEKHSSQNKLSGNIFDDFDGEIFHHSAHHKDHSKEKKHFSPLDVEIFDKLLNHEHQKHERLSLSNFLNRENKHGDILDMLKSNNEELKDDLSYPMDSLDYKSVVPTHRLLLGEPSTISEMLDQDLNDLEVDKVQNPGSGVVAFPFTAAERLVWDWQAVALASAVAACLLFFTVVAVYSIVHARQWRRLKTNFDNDFEEMSVKMGLINNHSSPVGASAADAVNTNLYLENLLGHKNKSSNIYTLKPPVS